ncbi:MAG: hypothetical protein KDK78_10445, partial [Chlamydiia bacterium]|nr:hypothetical protein [Chlamydiia bacterium]
QHHHLYPYGHQKPVTHPCMNACVLCALRASSLLTSLRVSVSCLTDASLRRASLNCRRARTEIHAAAPTFRTFPQVDLEGT